MARKKIREYHAKRLIKQFIPKYSNGSIDYSQYPVFLVTNETNFRILKHDHPELADQKLVMKPDMLFGKRGKNNLVILNKNLDEILSEVKHRLDQEVTIGHVKGKMTHFLIEKFLPHKEEYYLSIVSSRPGNVIRFSTAGGIEVEENWEKVKDLTIAIDDDIDQLSLDGLVVDVPAERKPITIDFIRAVYKIFCDLDFTLLEMNPFTFDSHGMPIPLDLHAELDDTAAFKNRKKWLDIEFPHPFGRTEAPEERYVEDLDSKTGASLKLTILNPHGKIWTMVAGGGASVVYTDAFADAGCSELLGNYGEYSGGPSEEETYEYAKTIISLATKYHEGKKALIIGGGIANFTDVAKTFKGITHAIEECQDALRTAQVRIWVRRGGPNYKAGLQMMRNLGAKLNLPIEVYGPEIGMTEVVPMAVEWVQS